MMLDIVKSLPQPNEAFAWVQADGLPRLECRELAAIAPHFFTTRAWQLGSVASRSENAEVWDEVARAAHVDVHQLARVHQVHGASVVNAEAALRRTPDADSLISWTPGVALAVQTADCVPLLIADRNTGAVAATHAGWRGIAANIPGATVAELVRTFQSDPRDLLAAIGPSIGACCYEVAGDVVERFGHASLPAASGGWFHDAPTASIRNASMPRVGSGPRPGRWFFDSWAAVRDLLVTAGIPADQIFTAALCTASHADAFCSFRRDGVGAGRLAGVISVRPPRP